MSLRPDSAPRHTTTAGEPVMVHPTGMPVLSPAPADVSHLLAQQERASLKAQLLDGAEAGTLLAEQLTWAYVSAGRRPLAEIGDAVGYSKATISKVLSGKMPPAWHLVRKLGVTFGVPAAKVKQEWHPLWIAADMHRRNTHARGTAKVGRPVEPVGRSCPECGASVSDAERHTAWHAREGRTSGWTAEVAQWDFLRNSVPRPGR